MLSSFKHGLVTQRVIDRLRLLGIVVHPYFLFREGVRPHKSEWPELASDFPSSVLAAADIPAVAASRRWNTVDEIRRRLAKGHLCIVLKNGRRIAGYTWADLAEVNDSACDYPLRAGEAYLYDAFIAPEFRGHSLAPYLRVESYKHLHQLGRHTFYSISQCFNAPAIKFKEKLNGEVMRLYLQIKLGRRELGHWMLRDYEASLDARVPQTTAQQR